MSFPPEFDGQNRIYENRLDLDTIPVFMERSGNNPMFIEISNIPKKSIRTIFLFKTW